MLEQTPVGDRFPDTLAYAVAGYVSIFALLLFFLAYLGRKQRSLQERVKSISPQ